MSHDSDWEGFKRQVRPIAPRCTAIATTAKTEAAAPSSTKRRWQTLAMSPHQTAPHLPALRVTLLPASSPDEPQYYRLVAEGHGRIEARLDLHHQTEAQAFVTTQAFIAKAAGRGWRILLIITGRGVVLQAAVPRWLQENAARAGIRWVIPAAPRHGGAGAWYVVMRHGHSKNK